LKGERKLGCLQQTIIITIIVYIFTEREVGFKKQSVGTDTILFRVFSKQKIFFFSIFSPSFGSRQIENNLLLHGEHT